MPHVVVIDDEADQNFEVVQSMCSTFCMTPVKNRVGVTKPLEESSISQLLYFKRKKEEFVVAAASFFDVANVLNENKDSTIYSDLQSLVECSEESDSFGKLAILSVVNHDIYSNEQLMKIFDCSRYKIDRA